MTMYEYFNNSTVPNVPSVVNWYPIYMFIIM